MEGGGAPGDRTIASPRTERLTVWEHLVVEEAVPPALPGLIGLKHRVTRGVEVPSRVLVLGVVAASDVAADQADS